MISEFEIKGSTSNRTEPELKRIQIAGENYLQISNVDAMRPFFMSIVSDSNHWMFIGSNGGISAGRKNSNSSLFPYYTDDKIIESAETTGSKSIFQVHKDGKNFIWEPFSIRQSGRYQISRNLYKNVYGNKVLFEEINHDLDLTFQYQWKSSNTYGFVKESTLINNGTDSLTISALDGIQNIIPHGVGSSTQNQNSNLVDAYKRAELKEDVGMGIIALSAIIVDKAEPSEALKATIVWSMGLDDPKHLLSSLQLDNFRNGGKVHEEKDIKAEKGAYFINEEIALSPKSKKEWSIISNLNQNRSTIAEISAAIKTEPKLGEQIKEDIEAGTNRLIKLTASADGLQQTKDEFRDTRHFSNTLFNIMRGGIFDNNYQVERRDVLDYLSKVNKEVHKSFTTTLNELPEEFPISKLKEVALQSNDLNFQRLCFEYMPLKFSRRHGDPSRPWNQFSINTHSEIDGSKILDYEGNWRDIFQNWEALAHSYPDFIESMISKFLNASTFDGYNPYRITKNGIDWETIEPDDPWSYIGYWGDHQIIYLLKFLEFAQNHTPGRLESYFNQEVFVYANVPYKIKGYADLLKDPKDTIEFDDALDQKIHDQWSTLGADSALLRDENATLVQVNFIEKMLATVLAKMSNFIPEAGIWMSTQRPEWNDANNALVGNGVSVVTLCYLRRFLKFFEEMFQEIELEEVKISEELLAFFNSSLGTLDKYQPALSGSITDRDRKQVLDGLGKAGSDYRLQIYSLAFQGNKESISISQIQHFITICLEYLEHTIRANKRHDNLYHAYNLMTLKNDEEISISYLSEMLEGQVAVLSSGYLSAEESVEVLDALKSSKLFREDQYSYLLYPNKDLPGFSEKNNIPEASINKSALLTKLIKAGNTTIVMKDIEGAYHFNATFKNAHDLRQGLDELIGTNNSTEVQAEKTLVLQIFEEVFNHKAFTGRSGTFFGYEGLGSIYWHMVSKLQLAVQESCLTAIDKNADAAVIGKLLEHYYEINQSIGIHKPPALYGAFPTDPYSHTPAGKGAQQPGMTGQVKEDILCRFGELGVFVKAGELSFNPCLLRKDEFLQTESTFSYVGVDSTTQELQLETGSLAFTYCQVPVVYKLAEDAHLEIVLKDGSKTLVSELSLDKSQSQQVFGRSGEISQIIAYTKETTLK